MDADQSSLAWRWFRIEMGEMEHTKQELRGEEPPPYAEPPSYEEQPPAAPSLNEPPQQNMLHTDAPSPFPLASYPLGSNIQGQPCWKYPTAIVNGQSAQSTVVMKQPGRFLAQQSDNNLPDSHICCSIFACLCCWSLGLAAIIKSIKVDKAVRRGDLIAANETSRKAANLAKLVIGFGACLFIIAIAMHFTLLSP